MSNPLQLSMVSFKQGAYIIVEGKQNANQFFIIRSGKVRLSKEVEIVAEEGGNVLTPGDFFGVVSTMSSHSHIETAQAVTDVNLISVSRDNYGLLIEKNTPVAMKIIESFSRRMRYLDEALTRLTQQSVDGQAGQDHLFEVAEYYVKQNQYNQAYFAYHQYLRFNPQGPKIDQAKERMAKIKPYQKAVYLNEDEQEFNRLYPKDTMIFTENMPGQQLYIIQKGQVKITKIMNDNEVLLAVLKPGDIFGEMSLLEHKPRSASAIAHEESVLLAVNRENFTTMVKSQPQIISKITTLMSERIWFIYKQLANTLLDNPVGKLYDALLIQLEKNRVEVRAGEAYSFDFGTKELIHMVGLNQLEGNKAVAELLKNKRFKAMDNKIYCADIDEIKKQAEYYRKMQRIARKREKSGR
ncbi:Crp/Fnr family transcriptional regulator [Salinispira pacifica]|nr:cyclic nucleotide-binding domain-containing protein [Salinispira pacifica]